MANSSENSVNPAGREKRAPSILSLNIICQYAKSLRIMKNLPIQINSFIIN